MTVGELLTRISSRELAEWSAYFRLAPFGDERADLRSAIVAATVANTARDPKKRGKPFEAAEFMPRFEEPEQRERQTWQEQLRIVELFNLALGGKDLREN